MQDKKIPVPVMVDELNWIGKMLRDFSANRESMHPDPGALRHIYNSICLSLEQIQKILSEVIQREANYQLGVKFGIYKADPTTHNMGGRGLGKAEAMKNWFNKQGEKLMDDLIAKVPDPRPWPVDPHAPKVTVRHYKIPMSSGLKKAVDDLRAATGAVYPYSPTAAAFAAEAMTAAEDKASETRIWENVNRRMKKSERITLMEKDITALRQELADMAKRFEDYIVRHIPAPGEIHFQTIKGTEGAPPTGVKVLGHNHRGEVCIVWCNNGQWFACFATQSEGRYFLPVQAESIVWYKKIS